ncbi:MAG: Bax inhibitor-1 family protein [Aquificota bacterium]|jgi:FtsH-binding integral membrane protein
MMWNQYPQEQVAAQVKQSLFVRTMNYTALWTVLYGIFVALLIGTGLDRVFGNPIVSLVLVLMVMGASFFIRDPINASKAALAAYGVFTSFALAAVSSLLIHYVAYYKSSILIAALVTTFLISGATILAARTVKISEDKSQAIVKFLIIVGIAAFIASIVNLFLKSGIFGLIIAVIFLLWSVAALFLTINQLDQIEALVGDNPEILDKLALWESVGVFIMFYNIFISILEILLSLMGSNEE